MKKIKMFNLPCVVKKPFNAEIPEDAEILCVMAIKGAPRLCLVTNELVVTTRKATFRFYANDEAINDSEGIYIGSFFLAEGKIILHLFEIPSKPEGLIVPNG